jgi:hypothetical protein
MRDGLRPGRSLPGREAMRSKPGLDGGPVPVANATEVAGFLREDTHLLHRTMQLDLVVAQYLVRLRDAVTAKGVPLGGVPLLELIVDLEEYADGLSASAAFSTRRGSEPSGRPGRSRRG